MGAVRLKMVEFFIMVLYLNNPAVNKKILDLNFVPHSIVSSPHFFRDFGTRLNVLCSLQDLFFRFPWNNFLHSLVHDLLLKIFDSELSNSQAFILNVRPPSQNQTKHHHHHHHHES